MTNNAEYIWFDQEGKLVVSDDGVPKRYIGMVVMSVKTSQGYKWGRNGWITLDIGNPEYKKLKLLLLLHQ